MKRQETVRVVISIDTQVHPHKHHLDECEMSAERAAHLLQLQEEKGPSGMWGALRRLTGFEAAQGSALAWVTEREGLLNSEQPKLYWRADYEDPEFSRIRGVVKAEGLQEPGTSSEQVTMISGMLQEFEELSGPGGFDYVNLMESLSREAIQRARRCRQVMQESSVAELLQQGWEPKDTGEYRRCFTHTSQPEIELREGALGHHHCWELRREVPHGDYEILAEDLHPEQALPKLQELMQTGPTL